MKRLNIIILVAANHFLGNNMATAVDKPYPHLIMVLGSNAST